MKASHFIVPAIFTFAAGFALAADEYKKFDEVDANKDGLLSVSEARTALPDLQITSGTSAGAASSTAASGDAMLTRDAVKRALPEISFEGGDERGPITEEEYDMIVEELEERGSSAASSSRSATGAASSSTRPSPDSQDSQGAASSSTDRNANSTSQPGASSSSGSQQSTPPATRPDNN